MNVFLIRHCQKIEEIGNVGLTSIGMKQASLLGNYLKSFGIDKFYSSKQKRAIETAKIVTDVLHKHFVITDALNERISYGEIPGQTYREYAELCKISTLNRDLMLPNGSTSTMAGKRIESLILSIPSQLKTICLISHGGVIVDFLRNMFSDEELESNLAGFKRNHMVEYGSITKLELLYKQFRMVSFGENTYLQTMVQND